VPWDEKNFPPAFRGLAAAERRKAIEIANAVLKDCLRRGGKEKECAARAIRVALARVGGEMEERIEEARTWKLNAKAYRNARRLIQQGKFTDAEWSAPSFRRDFGGDIEQWALFHLAKDPDGDPDNAGSYGYPYGKNGKVYVAALRAIRTAAAGGRGATPNREIFDAAGRLLEMVREMREEEMFEDALTWTVPLSEAAKVERDGNTVKAYVTLIKAGWSRNGRYYPPEVLERAAPLFERLGSFDGHIPDPKVTDYVGWFERVEFKENALRAVFHVFDEKLAKIVESAPHLVGLSINGEGKVVRGEVDGRKGWLVEDITAAKSVDVVVSPAAGGGINAILEACKEDEVTIETLEDLKKAYPDLVEELRRELKKAIYSEKEEERNKAKLAEAERLREEIEALKEENERLRRKVEVFESKKVLEEKLAEAELPEAAKERIRALFEDEVATEEAVAKAVEAEKAYLEKLASEMPVKGVKKEEDPLAEANKEALARLRKLFGLEEETKEEGE